MQDKKKKIIIFLIILIVTINIVAYLFPFIKNRFFSPDRNAAHRYIRDLAELVVSEYTFEKVIKIDKDRYLFGSRKILFSAKIIVKTGVSLRNIQAKDIQINSMRNVISIKIPNPKIISKNMPEENIRFIYEKGRQFVFFNYRFSDAEKQNILQQGLNSIEKKMKELGTFNAAKDNVVNVLTEFLKKLGFDKVEIKFSE